jgi:hypothetical protein
LKTFIEPLHSQTKTRQTKQKEKQENQFWVLRICFNYFLKKKILKVETFAVLFCTTFAR